LREIEPEDVLVAVNDLLRPPADVRMEIVQPALRVQACSRPFQRILVATKYRFIGDTILAIPALRAMARLWPEAKISVLTGAKAREVLRYSPYVHEVIEFDPYRASDRGLIRYVRLIRTLRQRQFDLAVVLNRSFHSALTAALGGARFRAGWSGFDRRDFLLQAVCPYRPYGSEIDCYLDVVRAVASEDATDGELELWLTDREKENASRMLGSGGPTIGMQPGATHQNKRWPAENYAELASRLIEEDPQRRIVLIGGPDERTACMEVQRVASQKVLDRTIDCVGKLDLRATLAMLTRLDVFVGNDTAIRHGAVAVNIPSLALFGPTSAQKWGNEHPPRHMVLTSPTDKMRDLPLEDVLLHTHRLLAGALVGAAIDG
jgi:lipopolysaccharide heptosyltransferase II